MEKLTIEELAPYLAHKLQCQLTAHTEFKLIQGVINEYVIIDRNYWHLDQIRPIMYPLSALTEHILEGCKIPIVELAKMAFPNSDKIRIGNKIVLIDFSGDYDFRYHESSFECVFSRYSPHVRFCKVPNQLQLFKQLYAWHFWLGDQSYFEKGLLIDKRTVK